MKKLEFFKKLGLVFSEKKYILIAVISSLSISFMYAILAEFIPIPGYSGIRMIPLTLFEIVFMIIFSLLAGITIAFYFYNLRNKTKGICFASSGIFLGLLSGICPFCPIVLLLLIGISIFVDFLSPIFPYLRIISLLLLLVSLYLASKNVETKRKK